MKDFKSSLIFLFACAFVFTACAEASLYNDPAAMAGFKNTTSFNVSLSGRVSKVDVQYAVYAPGAYPGDDITSGYEYIYAYQIFNSSQSNVAVDFFSVGILAGSSVNMVYTDETYGVLGGKDPFPFNFPQSAGYAFIVDGPNPGQWSDVLLFTSDYAPTMGFGTVSGGGLSVMGSLPTPSTNVPEPATIILTVGALVFLKSKKSNK